MTELTDYQTRCLNTCGADELMMLRDDGVLPDSVEVNARIATRIFWNNPVLWEKGRWFRASWIDGKYRRGPVNVRKITRPDESVAYCVVAPNGRWNDMLTETDAKKFLKALRVEGTLAYLDAKESARADNDLEISLSN